MCALVTGVHTCALPICRRRRRGRRRRGRSPAVIGFRTTSGNKGKVAGPPAAFSVKGGALSHCARFRLLETETLGSTRTHEDPDRRPAGCTRPGNVRMQIGRASWRERVCQYVYNTVVAG